MDERAKKALEAMGAVFEGDHKVYVPITIKGAKWGFIRLPTITVRAWWELNTGRKGVEVV